MLRDEEVLFQAVKTWKQSTDPDFEAKKNRVLELYDIAEGKATPGPGDPTVVFSMDEFGPLNLLPRASRQWTPVISRSKKGTTAARAGGGSGPPTSAPRGSATCSPRWT